MTMHLRCSLALAAILTLGLWAPDARAQAPDADPAVTPTASEVEKVYLIGDAPEGGLAFLAGPIGGLSSLDVSLRLVLVTTPTTPQGFVETVNEVWEPWSASTEAEFLGERGLVLFAALEPPLMTLRQGIGLRRDGQAIAPGDFTLVAQSWSQGASKPLQERFEETFRVFAPKLEAAFDRAREARKDLEDQQQKRREFAEKALAERFAVLAQLDQQLRDMRTRGERFNTDLETALRDAQADLSQAQRELEKDPGEANRLARQAGSSLEDVKSQLQGRAFEVEAAEKRAADLAARAEALAAKGADAAAVAAQTQAIAAARSSAGADPEASRRALEQITKRLDALEAGLVVATPPPTEPPPVEPQPGEPKPPEPTQGSERENPSPAGEVVDAGGPGGWIVLILFVVVAIAAVALVSRPDDVDAESISADVPGMVAAVEARLDTLRQEVEAAGEELNDKQYPSRALVPQRFAEFIGVEGEPADPPKREARDGEEAAPETEPYVSIALAPLYRGSSERAVRRAKSRYNAMIIQFTTLASSVEEARRWARSGNEILADRAIGRADRCRDLTELAEQMRAHLVQPAEAAVEGARALTPLFDSLDELEQKLATLAEKGVSPGALRDRLEESQEGLREACFMLLNDPIRSLRSVPILAEKLGQLRMSAERIEGALRLYDDLVLRVAEVSDAPLGTPFEPAALLASSAECLRRVGTELNAGQVEAALESLDKAEEALENRERTESVQAEAREALVGEVEAREKELDALRQRLDKSREALGELSEEFDPDAFHEVVQIPGIAELWLDRFEDMIEEAQTLEKDDKLLEMRLLTYYMSEKQAEIGSLLDQITAKRFELTSERERAQDLRKRLESQHEKLEDYFQREKSAIRGYARQLLAEAAQLFESLPAIEEGEPAHWPRLAAQLHECAQLYDLARNAAEDDVALLRRAWSLQTGVSRNLQCYEDEVDDANRKAGHATPPNIARLAKIRYETLQRRFEGIRQNSFSDENERWQTVSRSLEEMLRQLMKVVQPIGRTRDSQVYVQAIVDGVEDIIRRGSLEDPERKPDFASARSLLDQANQALKGSNPERAMELACQAEDAAETALASARRRSVKDRDARRIELFGLIRSVQRRREELVAEQNEEAVTRANAWMRADPKDQPWSRQTFWTRGLTLGLLDPLPAAPAGFPDFGAEAGPGDDVLDTRKMTSPAAQGEDPFAKFAGGGAAPGGDPFAAFAAGSSPAEGGGDPFAAFAPGAGDPGAAFADSPIPQGDDAVTEVDDDAVEVEGDLDGRDPADSMETDAVPAMPLTADASEEGITEVDPEEDDGDAPAPAEAAQAEAPAEVAPAEAASDEEAPVAEAQAEVSETAEAPEVEAGSESEASTEAPASEPAADEDAEPTKDVDASAQAPAAEDAPAEDAPVVADEPASADAEADGDAPSVTSAESEESRPA